MYKVTNKNKINTYSIFVWTLCLILPHYLVRWFSVFVFFYDPFGWFSIAGHIWLVCVTVLSHFHFIIFDLERIRCATTSVSLQWLHVSIHLMGPPLLQGPRGPQSAGPVAIATFATIVNPALSCLRNRLSVMAAEKHYYSYGALWVMTNRSDKIISKYRNSLYCYVEIRQSNETQISKQRGDPWKYSSLFVAFPGLTRACKNATFSVLFGI